MYRIIGADGKEYGPITADQLRQWMAEGRANAQTRILAEGTTEWKSLAEFPEFSTVPTGAPETMRPLTAMPMPGAQGPRNNPLAVTGLILGIVSLLACCCYGLPFNIGGIVCSAIGLNQIKKDPANQRGRGMAIAGLIMSILSIILYLILLVL